jgi:ABC-2 type transport system permease protein
MDKIRTIMRKEWAQLFRNRLMMFSLVLMPLLFTAIPLIILGVTGGTATGNLSATELPPQFAKSCPPGLAAGACFQYYLVSSFLVMFMLTPILIPVNISAFSIVGEKTTRSLEPLLATPITTLELLVGKNLAATIPAVVATWLGFAVFIVGALVISGSVRLVGALLSPMWLLAVLIIGPLLAILAVNASIMISSRVNDVRVAQQLSAVIVLPLLLVLFGQLSGLFVINVLAVIVTSAVLVGLDAGLVYLAVRVFQRETILTKWR